ncbi:MAG TPA: DegT/DnrJ/EryC1/StrS family aminotransferase [Pontibacter sp.]
MPFPLDQENCKIFSRARHAVWNACRALHLGNNDAVLVPAYHHGSEVESLLQAGLQVIYYEVNDALEPDPGALERLLTPNVRALYIIHYLGFPQKATMWKRWCEEHGLLLIEDAAQAFLATSEGKPVGSFGDMGVFCLYKTYGLPDGGAIVSKCPPAQPSGSSSLGLWKTFKRHVNWIAARQGGIASIHLVVKPLIAKIKRQYERQHQEFELGEPSTPSAAINAYLIPRIVDAKTAERRRANYSFLLDNLKDIVPFPFSVVPEGACPFAFPIEVRQSKNFLRRLQTRGVIGLLFWLNPHPSLPVENFPKSKALREHMLALPVHQELTRADLIQIVNAVKESLHEVKADLKTA